MPIPLTAPTSQLHSELLRLIRLHVPSQSAQENMLPVIDALAKRAACFDTLKKLVSEGL